MFKSAVILAAGVGRRLAPRLGDVAKPLVRVAGEPIIVRLVRQLVEHHVDDITVVVGHHADRVRAALSGKPLAPRVSFVESRDHAVTNNSVSLALAGQALERGTLLLEGDVVADDGIIRQLVEGSGPAWLVRPFASGMDGAFIEGAAGGPAERLSIVPRGAAASGPGWKSLGLLRFDPDYGRALVGWLADELQTRRDRYYDLVVADHLAERAVRVEVAHGRWTEIDTPEDLDHAIDLFGEGP